MMGTKAILQLNSFIEVLEFRIPQGILNNQKTAEGTGHRQMSHRPCPESGPLAAGPSPPLLLNQLPAEVSRGGTKPNKTSASHTHLNMLLQSGTSFSVPA